jgi:hypothetical protein
VLRAACTQALNALARMGMRVVREAISGLRVRLPEGTSRGARVKAPE